MSVILVQPPPRADLVEIFKDPDGKLRGRITRPWQNYLDDFFSRAGGNVAPSNDELAALIDSAQLGVFKRVGRSDEPADIAYVDTFSRRHECPPQPADIRYVDAFSHRQPFIQAPPDIGYVDSFSHRQSQSTPIADASSLLCIRSFAR